MADQLEEQIPPAAPDDTVVDIVVDRGTSKTTQYRIAGEVYAFRRPKTRGLIDVLRDSRNLDKRNLDEVVRMFDRIEEWLFRCLSPDEAERLKARLADEDDEVDVEHIIAVFQKMVGRTSGRPPTPPSV